VNYFTGSKGERAGNSVLVTRSQGRYNRVRFSGEGQVRWIVFVIPLCLVFSASGQNVNPGYPAEIQAQKHVSPEEMRQRLAGAELQKDAKELSELCAVLPKDMDAVKQGMVPKDTIDRLKRMEKLSKRVREQLVRAGSF